MNQSPNRNTGKPTSHREDPHKLADNLGAAVSRLELVAYFVQLTQSHLWMHQTWSERERERERERGAMGSRAVEGWDGWGQWQLSTAETRTDWRSDHPVVLDVPSAAIFSLRPSARCAVAHVRLRWRRRRRLVAVGENFLFSSLAWQLGRWKGVYFRQAFRKNRLKIALQVSKLGFSPIVMP